MFRVARQGIEIGVDLEYETTYLWLRKSFFEGLGGKYSVWIVVPRRPDSM